MTDDRQHLVVPWPRRMRADYRQLREVGGYVVQINWTRVIQPHPHASRCACSQSIGACMKQRGHSKLVDLLVKRIELFVVWIESLNSGMKLRTDQPQFCDRALHLVNRAIAFPGINASEAYKLARILLDDIGYFVV